MNAADEERPIYNIEGELVALGPLSRDHLLPFTRWINDFGTTANLALQPSPVTREQEQAWLEGATSRDDVRFAIYERATARLIGACGIHELTPLHRRAVVGIMIGDPHARGRGYGTEAMRLLLDYCFTILGLHNVMLTLFEYNHAARRSYEKVGFREIGRRREARWHNGRFWDEIMMDILASEFESPVLQKLMAQDAPPVR